MKKLLSSLVLSSSLLLSSCYAREMYLIEPVVSFQEEGVKTILFVGFNSYTGLKVDPKFQTKLENLIYREIEKFSAIKVIRVDPKDKLGVNYRTSDLTTLANKYKSELVVIGDIRNYIESKYIDQPIGGFSNTPTIINDNSSARTLNRFQINVLGSINLIKSDGKVLWTQKIEDIELTQYENNSSFNRETDTQELAAYINTRDKLAETITSKLIRNLLPYYNYR